MTAIEGLVREPAFPEEEYQARLAGLRTEMRREAIDGMLVHQPPSVFYFSGYENLHVYDHECVVVPLEGPSTLVVPAIDESRARFTASLPDVVTVPADGETAEVLARALRHGGLADGRVGVEKRVARAAGLSVHVFEGLQRALPRAAWVDASGLPERVKLVKSAREIAHLRQAARYTDAGLRAALAAAAEGRTDNDVAAAAYQAMMAAGSEFLAIPAIVNRGTDSGITHSTHRRLPLPRGDVLFLELGGCHRRYSAPCVRTASVGPPSDEVRRLADASFATLANMHAVLRPGVAFDAVARAGAAGVSRAGPDVYWGGDYGYPVGAGFPPHWGDYSCGIRLGWTMTVEAGMVFHQPVSFRRLGRVGVGFSETVLITDAGCELLTRTPRELTVV
jgi:Xaa-Pro aminopeptidase